MMDRLFEGPALWFSVPALIGTAVFGLRLVLMLLGGDADGGADADVDLSPDLDGGDSTSAFSLLSIQSVSAFLAGFGWGGIGAHLGTGWGPGPSVAVGVVCGLAMVWLLGLLLKGVYDLQASGNISPETYIGVTGEVYATIPGHRSGMGQVKLVVQDRQRICNALSADESLPTHTRVRVLSVNPDHSLNVTLA